MARHHVVRERRVEEGAQVGERQLRALGHAIRRQPLLPSAHLNRHDDRVGDAGVRQQRRLDLAQFDAKAAHLDLEVEAAEVLHHPVGAPAGEVARAIHPCATRALRFRREHVRHEAFGRELRAPMVAEPDLHPGEHEFPGHADRAEPSVRVKHMQTRVRDRASDRHQGRRHDRGRAAPVTHVHRTLGRAVQVVQPGAGQCGVERGHDIRRQRLAARDDRAQRRASRRPCIGKESAQHRRHEVARRDAACAHRLGQVARVAMHGGTGHHEPRARHERPEELPHRDVERERRLLQHGVLSREPIRLLHPAQPVHDAAVGVERALGPPRRSRRVDHVRGVVAHRQRQWRAAVARLGAPFEQHDLGGAWRQGGAHRSGGQQQLHAAVLEHERHALGRVLGIDRHVAPAGAHHRTQGNRQLDRTLGRHAHAHASAHARRTQPTRQGTRRRLAFRVGETRPLVLHRHRIRRQRRLRDEGARERLVGARDHRPRPLLEQLRALRGTEQLEATDRRVLAGHRHGAQHRGEVAEHPLDRIVVEAACVVHDAQQHAFVGIARKRQRKGVLLVQSHGTVGPGAALALHDRLELVALEHHDAVEHQLAGRHARGGVDHRRRRMLVIAQRLPGGAHRLQPLAQRRRLAHPHAQRHGGDEEPDHVVGIRHRAAPSGARHTEGDVGLARVAREHQRPRGLHHGVERDAVGLREVAQSGDRIRLEPHLAVGLRGARRVRHGARIRERCRVRHAAKRRAPEGFARRLVLARDPLGERRVGQARRLHRQRPAVAQRLVVGEGLAEEDREAPTIEQRVVQAVHERRIPLGELYQRDPPVSGQRQVEAAQPVLAEERLESRRPLGRAYAAPVERGQRHRHAREDARLGHLESVPRERGAQRLVMVPHPLPGGGHRAHVHGFGHRNHDLPDVHAGAARAHGRRQHAQLERRERARRDVAGSGVRGHGRTHPRTTERNSPRAADATSRIARQWKSVRASELAASRSA